MERKETITMLELVERVQDRVSADTLAEKYLLKMEWLNLPECENLDYLFQLASWFVIDGSDAKYLLQYSDEIIAYVEEIDMYFWAKIEEGTSDSGVEIEMIYDY